MALLGVKQMPKLGRDEKEVTKVFYVAAIGAAQRVLMRQNQISYRAKRGSSINHKNEGGSN